MMVNMHGSRRTMAALLVVVSVASLLTINVPGIKPDLINLEEVRFWLSIESAIAYFFAAGFGAIVARKAFLVPEVTIAIVGWALMINILHNIAVVAGPVSYVEIAEKKMARAGSIDRGSDNGCNCGQVVLQI